MDIITMLRNRLEHKINYTLPALLPNKFNMTTQGLVTSGENVRGKRAIPALAIIQGIAAIGGMMIKGVNVLVDAKRASSFNNAIKFVNKNVQITHDRLITLENRTAMMAKAIIPVLKDFKEKINSMNKRLTRQYRMMIRAHDRYNTLFRQTYKTFQIHHLALLTIDDLLLQLPVLIKLKIQVPMLLFSIETAPVPLDAETYIGEKREYTQIIPETELIAPTETNYVPLTQAQISFVLR